MTRSRSALTIPFVLLLLAACTPAASTPTSEPTPTAASESPTTAPTDGESPDASASSSPIGGQPGGFPLEANDEADELFENRFSCQNLDAGYEVDFPAEWNANAEFTDVPQCSWFAATEYEAGDTSEVPDEVTIVMVVMDGPREYGDAEVTDRTEGFIGVTQEAYRATVESDDETVYEYVVLLGESFDEGPLLVASASRERGDDFELSRAVLDRMMATMEFIGVIQ